MKKVFIIIVITFISSIVSSSQEFTMLFPNGGNYETVLSSHHGYGDDKDGYIHKGRITLYRVGSGQGDTFELYVKSATRYVKYKGRYYKIDGVQYVTINNIKYKTR